MDLPGRIVVAHHYDRESENRIHGDFTAAEYGFARGLVPGVALYAYLTIPVVQTLGREWLAAGRFDARFLKPVYDGERLKVLATVLETDPLRIACRLEDAQGAVRAEAVAEAGAGPEPAFDAYPLTPLPMPADRRTPTSDDLTPGLALGSKVFAFAPGHGHDLFVDLMVDPLPIYRGPGGAAHPALLVAQLNELLVQNVELGPWLHAGTAAAYFAVPLAKERLSLRARIAECYERKGHLFAVFDAACFGQRQRPVAHLRHTAIVRPRKPA